MPLEVIMRDEVAASLVATATAMLSTAAAHGNGNREYCQGAVDAIRAIAIAHRCLPDVVAQVQVGDVSREALRLLEG